MLKERGEIRKVVRDYFKELYKKEKLICIFIIEDGFNRIFFEESNRLEELLIKEEIKDVIWSCDLIKVLGY